MTSILCSRVVVEIRRWKKRPAERQSRTVGGRDGVAGGGIRDGGVTVVGVDIEAGEVDISDLERGGGEDLEREGEGGNVDGREVGGDMSAEAMI